MDAGEMPSQTLKHVPGTCCGPSPASAGLARASLPLQHTWKLRFSWSRVCLRESASPPARAVGCTLLADPRLLGLTDIKKKMYVRIYPTALSRMCPLLKAISLLIKFDKTNFYFSSQH